jgi:hypothetical protein
MFDRSRLSRLVTLALASCAVTWAFSAGAFARFDNGQVTTAGPAPAYKAVAGDTDKAPSASPPPAFKAVAGDTDKAPSASRPPAFKAIVVDANKTPDPATVNRNLTNLNHGGKTGGPVVSTGDDETGTIALIFAIAAMLVALAAVTLLFVGPQRPVLRS